jgi:PAS domain S-box-containing protein
VLLIVASAEVLTATVSIIITGTIDKGYMIAATFVPLVLAPLFLYLVIAGRKNYEEALYESRERFRNMVEMTSDWVWETDENIVFTYVSPKVRDILGYKPEELLGKVPFDFMSPEDARRVAEDAKAIAAFRKPFSALENKNIHKDGHLVTMETSGVPFFDTEGALLGYRGINRDITERKIAEMKREQLISELKDALAQIKTLKGLIPMCAWCKKIRDDKGYWNQVEAYIAKHSDAAFTHGICPECLEKVEEEEKKKTDNPLYPPKL